ncbi:MAG: F0F1 ATP synthase subunit epsilon [Pseudomonadota bacterium]
MADTLHFSLVSPARELFSGEVDHVIAPGTEGEFGVLPDHAPFMTTLKNGLVRVLGAEGGDKRIFVRGGFADVTPAGLTILAEEAVDCADVDVAALDGEIQTAKERMLAHAKDDGQYPALEAHVQYLESLKQAVVN